MNSPDIIFIVLDTQRADRLGCYGHRPARTPNLDQFAQDGVLFEQAIAPAQWTIPSHASMFTGLYPTAHRLTQSSQSLSPEMPHLVELLRGAGYHTIGFCNNPLVGILNNGLKRGFRTFYNYGGAFPSLPKSSTRIPWPLNRLVEGYTQFLRRISYPIQNFFGRSDLAFRISLNAWLTPLWSKFANFKGQNARSVRDVIHYLGQREKERRDQPLFLFLNLMETHLPFWPPSRYVNEIAPYFKGDKEALKVMRTWNREAFRWGAPLAEPLGELESRVLNDMYDAEVAYQDDYLGPLFNALNARANRDNTLTIIVADHGDGLGDHGYFGHAFVAYQELVHVPLILHWPRRLPEPGRISTPVSIRRLFHTVLHAAQDVPLDPGLDKAMVDGLSLMHTVDGKDPEKGTVYSEIYPPLNFLRAVESHWPELVEAFRCTSLRRAVVEETKDGTTYKLIEVDDRSDEMFDLTSDAGERQDLLPALPSQARVMSQKLRLVKTAGERERALLAKGEAVDVGDPHLLQQLRGLGYIE